MTLSLWLILVGCAGALVMGLGIYMLAPRRARPDSDAAEEWVRTPIPPLKRLAWWALGLGGLVSAAVAAVLVNSGPTAFQRDAAVRILVSLLCVLGLSIPAVLMLFARRRVAAQKLIIDERDVGIVNRAAIMQQLLVVLALVVWTLVLTELYWEAGQIPIVYLTLIFWSCMLVNVLALPIGILLGYRRR